MRYSESYTGTVQNDQAGLDKIALVRATVGKVNRKLKADGVTGYRYAVVVRGRLGRDNPNAVHYRRGGRHWRWSSITIRPEHSTRFDVYVHRRLISRR